MFRILIILALLSSPCFAKDKKPTDADKAKVIIEQDRKDRQVAAGKEIESTLKKYRLKLSVGMLVTDQGNIPQLNLVPVD